MHRPLISVITISFNSIAHIEKAILSVIYQKNADFEYILIDGGSTDGTAEIISKYHDKIKYWHSKLDFGITDAFNMGIKNSSGKWLVFINSDDAFNNDQVLNQMSKYLSDDSFDVIYGKVQLINRNAPFNIISKPLGKNYNYFRYLFNNLIPHQSSFINSDFFKKYGLYSMQYTLCADYELFLRARPLKALSVDFIVSLISDFGASRLNSSKVIREWYLARKSNRACHNLLNRFILFYSLLKLFIKNLIVRLFR
jgi:glycosyltransferase involved in cell wall biosynthesis